MGGIAVSIEKPNLNTKMPPGDVWKLSACLKIMTICFVAMSAIAGAALGMTISLRSDMDELRARLATLSTPSPTPSPTAAVAISTSAVAPAGFTAVSLFDGEWAPGVQMPEERSDHQAVFCAGKIVLLGGLNISGEAVVTTWSFDPIIETFDVGKASMPTARYRFGAACLDGKVYVAGGYPTKAAGDAGLCLTSVDVYDVTANSWAAAAPLSLARGDLALAVAGGRLYAMGGYGYAYPYPDPANEANEAYSPQTNVWTAMAPLPGGGKGDISAVEISGTIYVPGVWNGGFKNEPVAFAPSNGTSGTWDTNLAAMGRARGDKALAVLEGHIYVIGGEIWSGKVQPCAWDPSTTCNINALPIHNCELYSPSGNAWTSFAPIPNALFRFAAAAANGIIFVFGGQGHGQVAVNTVSKFLHAQKPDVYLHVKQ